MLTTWGLSNVDAQHLQERKHRMGSTLQVERFTITIAEEILDDLRRRITTLGVRPYTGECLEHDSNGRPRGCF
jgi:hypothetical protein